MPRPRLLIALGVALLLVGCGRTPAPQVGLAEFAPGDREAVPALAGTTLAGDPLALQDARGSVVVLNNWASWCAPCRDEAPVLAAAARDHADVVFVGLDVSDEQAAAEQFVAETGIPYPSIVDADGALLASIPGVPAKSLPSTLVIDREGGIAARFIGPVSAPELDRVIDAVVSE